jgi:hypothetical protein
MRSHNLSFRNSRAKGCFQAESDASSYVQLAANHAEELYAACATPECGRISRVAHNIALEHADGARRKGNRGARACSLSDENSDADRDLDVGLPSWGHLGMNRVEMDGDGDAALPTIPLVDLVWASVPCLEPCLRIMSWVSRLRRGLTWRHVPWSTAAPSQHGMKPLHPGSHLEVSHNCLQIVWHYDASLL